MLSCEELFELFIKLNNSPKVGGKGVLKCDYRKKLCLYHYLKCDLTQPENQENLDHFLWDSAPFTKKTEIPLKVGEKVDKLHHYQSPSSSGFVLQTITPCSSPPPSGASLCVASIIQTIPILGENLSPLLRLRWNHLSSMFSKTLSPN